MLKVLWGRKDLQAQLAQSVQLATAAQRVRRDHRVHRAMLVIAAQQDHREIKVYEVLLVRKA